MAEPTYNPSFSGRNQVPDSEKTFLRGYLFGVPVRDIGLFASVLMGIASGFIAFFAATFLAIFFVLIYNGAGHNVDFAATYKYFGFPIGIVVMVLALGYMLMLWVRRQVTRR